MNTPLLQWKWHAPDRIWTARHPLWDAVYVIRRAGNTRGCQGGGGNVGGVGGVVGVGGVGGVGGGGGGGGGNFRGWRALDENGDAIGSPHRSHVVAAHACSARLMRDLVRIEASKDEAMANRMTCRRLIDEFNIITRRKFEISKKKRPSIKKVPPITPTTP